MNGERQRGWSLRRLVPLGVALVATVAFRLPALLNADDINSDAAIVGVQARHMLEGEFTLRLWGSPYQAPLEPLLAALLFGVTRQASALGVLFVPLLEMLVMVALAWVLAERRCGAWLAVLAVSPLVLATHAVNAPMLYVMRQSIATLAFAVLIVADGAAARSRPSRFLLVGVLVGAGPLLDTYFVVLVLPLLVFSGACVFRVGERRAAAGRALAASFIVVTALAQAVVRLSGWSSHVGRGDVSRNWTMLWRECLPFALGIRSWMPGSLEWEVPTAVHVLQVLAATALFGALIAMLIRSRRTPAFSLLLTWALGAVVAIAAFLVSSAPFDMWSTRYLAPMLWFLPLALAAFLAHVRRSLGVLVVVPWLANSAAAGWASYGDWVAGPRIVITERGAGRDALALRAQVTAFEAQAVAAPYWEAYRLSLLWNEQPIVVPIEAELDRYAPLRARALAARRTAAITSPSALDSLERFRAELLEPREVERVAVAEWLVIGFETGSR